MGRESQIVQPDCDYKEKVGGNGTGFFFLLNIWSSQERKFSLSTDRMCDTGDLCQFCVLALRKGL